MQDERLFVLLGKKLNNEATPEELEELAQLLDQAALHYHTIELIREVWHKQPAIKDRLPDEKWDQLSAKLFRENVVPEKPHMPVVAMRRPLDRKWLAVASVLLCVLLTVWYQLHRNDETVPGYTHSVALDTVIYALNGERKRVVLPDSTKVHLNSGSKLVYNKKFNGSTRQVYLSGEALFDVSKNPSRPFLVNTDKMMVRVLGTVFNVKCYETSENVEAMVVEGKVEVRLKQDAEKKVILLPSEKISIRPVTVSHTQQQAPIRYEVESVRIPDTANALPNEIAWVQEKLVFQDDPFELVVLKMERWYNKRFHFENEQLKSILMSGDFEAVDLEQALQILQMMVDFEYEYKGDDVYLK